MLPDPIHDAQHQSGRIRGSPNDGCTTPARLHRMGIRQRTPPVANGVPGSLVGGRDDKPESERPFAMTAPFLIRGDALPALAGIPEAPREDRPHGMLWGVNLTGCSTRKQARAAWHDAVAGLKAELDTTPGIKRVCVACVRPKGFPQHALVRVPAGLAAQLHNDLERDRARYVNTLVLDVTECDNPDLLRTRLEEALAEPSRWGDLTIAWDDIADSTLREAWARDTL